jgi:hypothetical protein
LAYELIELSRRALRFVNVRMDNYRVPFLASEAE